MGKILITGATGHLGKSAVETLLNKGITPSNISVLVRDEKKATDLQAKGINIIKGDYEDYASLVSAFKGVDKLLFVSSNDVAKRLPQQENVVKAAKEAGVKHIVYTSFERVNETETSPIAFVAAAHLNTEKLLKESGLTYTILRNNLYMDMLPVFVGEQVLQTGTIYFPAGNGKGAVALRSEMGEAAANVLIINEQHKNKEYSLSNKEAYSYQDVANAISDITGKTINYVSPSVQDYSNTLTHAGVPAEYVGMFSAFAVAQEQGEFDVVSNDLEKLLGRKPTSLKDFFKTVYSSNN